MIQGNRVGQSRKEHSLVSCVLQRIGAIRVGLEAVIPGGVCRFEHPQLS